LDYAWNPDKWNEDNLQIYYTNWAAQQFGEKYAKEIGTIIQKYTQYNARRKPELLSPETYSLINYNEASTVVKDYNDLLAQAEKINNELPDEYKDAFYELVLHPVKACTNLNELYVTVAHNWQAAHEKSKAANDFADKAKQLYANDSLISLEYNTKIANGKWNHMMDQTHIGYTYWQQPPVNSMPEIKYVPKDSIIMIDDSHVVVNRNAKYLIPKNIKTNVFFEADGVVSINAEHYSKAINQNNITWKVIPGLGKISSSITTFPVTLRKQELNSSSPYLEYDFYSYDSGSIKIISIDDEKPQIISINKEDNNKKIWEEWVADNIIIKTSAHHILKPRKHVIKYWMISPAVILQKIVLDFGGLKASYLGPPETKFKSFNK
jgi:hypothetical protein